MRKTAQLLGIEGVLQRRPKELSGGQRQRVALGRAIVREPRVFLMDEPLSNLDAALRMEMRAEIIKLQERLGVTTFYVTHDQVEALSMGDRIVVMRDGRIQQIGSPTELYEQPKNAYVASFIGSPPMNFLEGRVEGDRIVLPAEQATLVDERRRAAGARPRFHARDHGRRPAGAHRLLRQAGRGRRVQHRGRCRYGRAPRPYDAGAGEDGVRPPAERSARGQGSASRKARPFTRPSLPIGSICSIARASDPCSASANRALAVRSKEDREQQACRSNQFQKWRGGRVNRAMRSAISKAGISNSLYGVVEAAEEARAPVIIGFNGEFLSRPERLAAERLSWYGALGRAAAADAKIPCGFIFNECAQDEWTRAAVTAGFNLVMPADPAAPYDDYARRVTRSCAIRAPARRRRRGGARRASGRHSGFSHGKAEKTDPQGARAFVEATGVDLLAVSVGNIHVSLSGPTALDLDRLMAIRQAVDVPLVLHGGTGIADDSLRQASRIGVAKVNYGTGLKQRYLAAVRRALAGDETNPHALLGMGGPEDVMVAGRRAVREAVLERLPALGCRREGMRVMAEVGCAGILVADMLCGPIVALPRPGQLLTVDDIPIKAGGCAANVAIDLARQKVSAAVVGCVGRDVAAQAPLAALREHGVDCDSVIESDRLATSKTVILLVARRGPSLHPFFRRERGAHCWPHPP